METPTFRPGLENVVVAETDLSLVDGEAGRLIVRWAAADQPIWLIGPAEKVFDGNAEV